MATITIKLDLDEKAGPCRFDLDEGAEERIQRECQRSGRDRDAVILDIVTRTIRLMDFEAQREKLAPYAKKAGYTEEEILAWPRMPAKSS